MTIANANQQSFIRLRSKTSGEWFAHPDLRRHLVEDAREQNSNMTEIAIRILCEHFGIDYEPGGRRATARPEADVLNLNLPPEVRAALKRTYDPYTDGAREILCLHYGLEPPIRARRNDAGLAPSDVA